MPGHDEVLREDDGGAHLNTIEFSAAVCSGKGRRREHNEDNLFFNGRFLDEGNRDDDLFFSTVEKDSRQLLYGVFDGMGGESLGELASFLTAEVVAAHFGQIRESGHVDIVSFIYHVVRDANNTVCAKAEEKEVRRMGTTFTALSIQDDTAVFFNMGDSRAFLFRNGVLRQITVDDTTVRRKIEMGLITPEEAKYDKDRHKITNFIGIPPEKGGVGFHTSFKISVRKGDRFLISSDGLTDMVEENRISEILADSADAPEAADRLFKEAMDNGGRDNITIIVLEALTEAVPEAGIQESGASEDRPDDEPVTIKRMPEPGSGEDLQDPPEDESEEDPEGKLDAFDLAFLASLMAEDTEGAAASADDGEEAVDSLQERSPVSGAPVQSARDRVGGVQEQNVDDRKETPSVRREPDPMAAAPVPRAEPARRRSAGQDVPARASQYPKRQKLDIVKEKEANKTWKVLLIITASVIAFLAVCTVCMNHL